MKRHFLRFAPWIALLAIGVVATPRPANPEPQPRGERHARLRAAYESMRDAQEYMRSTPTDFCGHKGPAMRANEAAMSQLRAAMECMRY